MSTTESRILVRSDHLIWAVKAVRAAAAPYQYGDAPSHFTETIRLEHADGHKGEVTLITACDSYRFHQVELGFADSMNTGSVLLPVNWIMDLLPKLENHVGHVELVATARQRGKKNVIEHVVVLTFTDGAQDEWVQEVTWDMDTVWPDMEKLFTAEETFAADTDVGFNVGFLRDMLDAAVLWWNDYGVSDSFPLRVRNFTPSRVSRFTLRNDIGELTVGICPALTQDYLDDDEDF